LYNLCNILAETKIHQLSYIKDKYLENGLWFDETLSFLEDLQITKIVSKELIPSKSFFKSFSTLSNFKEQLLLVLISSRGTIYDYTKAFLINFRKEKGEIFFNPTQTEKIKYSDIRNLLQELEFVFIDQKNDNYFINSNQHNLFLEFICKKGITSETLKDRLEENDDIGFKAESKVIEYELNRLTNIVFDRNDIEHTSNINALAGYDIKSYENYLDNNLQKVERFIEVKAVSITDYRFYWTRNEIEIASILGSSYYLYLLPVLSKYTFDLKNLKIIKDPFTNVYLNLKEWIKTEECSSFAINPDL
jgi:hypothetical protein